MNLPTLTGAQKTKLRGIGQRLPDGIHVGKNGVTPAFLIAFEHMLATRELLKLRIEGANRHEQAALCATIAGEAKCLCLGSVGHTALFWRPGAEGSKLLAP